MFAAYTLEHALLPLPLGGPKPLKVLAALALAACGRLLLGRLKDLIIKPLGGPLHAAISKFSAGPRLGRCMYIKVHAESYMDHAAAAAIL